MMTSKDAARYKRNDNSDKGKLLNEIESLSKALYLDKKPSKSSASAARNKLQLVDKPNSVSKHSIEGQSTKDKKSFWNWKPLKALSHVRNQRFNCCFTLDVHSIKGLPSKFNDTIFCVHWKRRDGEVVTSPIKVVSGVVEFEEKLTHTCSVYGSRSGPHHSAKYEAKHFLLYAAVNGNPKLDLGKHRVDLTRLLPLTLEELEDEKSSGTWTTTFKLSGEAKGAIMNVSFGYVVLGDGSASGAPNNKNVLRLLDSKASTQSSPKKNRGDGIGFMRTAGSLPANLKSSAISPSVDDVKVLHEVPSTRMSEFSNSVNMLYQKFEQENLDSLVEDKCEIAVPVDNDDKSVKSVSNSLSDPFQETMVNDENSVFSFIEKVVEGEKSTLVEDGVKDVDDIINSECREDYSDINVSGKQEADIRINEFVESSHFLSSDSIQENIVKDQNLEFLVSEKGVEFSEEKSALVEDGEKVTDVQGIISSDFPFVCSDAVASHQEIDFERDESVRHDSSSAKENICTKESILEDLESVLSNVAKLEKEALDSPDTLIEANNQEYMDEDDPNIMMPSLSLDHLAENVADEFLTMLGIEDSSFTLDSEGEPESPRERLLREFEKEAEASGCTLFGFGINEEFVDDDEILEDDEYCAPTISGWEDLSDDSDHLAADYSEYPMIRAKVMEDLETQELMQEWGLDENAFHSSPSSSKGDFGNPVDHLIEEPSKLPPLGEGLGPFIQTKSGGFLRSMNPTLFKEAKSGGSLIMQVSRPVVVPAELGSQVMDIVQHLASMGIEKLSTQANKLMPLEDITGRTMQQMAWEAAPRLEASESQNLLQDQPNDCHVISARMNEAKEGFSGQKYQNMALDDAGSEFASLEDLAPLAIDKIEALSIEGLRIQSGMSDQEAPSNISAQSIGEFSSLEGKRVTSLGSMGLEGTAGLKLLALQDIGADGDDELMGLSLTLGEWMKLDSGELDEDERQSERTSKLLAAHHAKSTDLNLFGKGERKQGRRCGLLGNNFTVALMVQLRDPLRDYEPVGTPMLALIQVERVFVPPKPKIYCRVSDARDNSSDEDDVEPISKEEKMPEPKEEKIQEEDLIPQYKISEVHVSGLKSEPGKKKSWGSASQQQSGSRWLLANGMGKGSKNSFMKPKIAAKSSLPATITSKPGDTLWSISAQFNGNGSKWKELAALNPHIRNPNVILSNETIKLR